MVFFSSQACGKETKYINIQIWCFKWHIWILNEKLKSLDLHAIWLCSISLTVLPFVTEATATVVRYGIVYGSRKYACYLLKCQTQYVIWLVRSCSRNLDMYIEDVSVRILFKWEYSRLNDKIKSKACSDCLRKIIGYIVKYTRLFDFFPPNF